MLIVKNNFHIYRWVIFYLSSSHGCLPYASSPINNVLLLILKFRRCRHLRAANEYDLFICFSIFDDNETMF
ncbi:hypothetical protein Dda3937_03369 [Dickeya dadantii 3937]|uniref:Uncharacterized protein n=1 Tax=Dickeya dadantii (strain 3937) TaxID=198628 RepID=E0SAZ0_DICD3|nr:hypothetical protein Dda3937_03369 [Dickeya dadantii 3937]